MTTDCTTYKFKYSRGSSSFAYCNYVLKERENERFLIKLWHTVILVTNGVGVMSLARISGGKDSYDVVVIAPVTTVIDPSVIFAAKNSDLNTT